MKYRHFAVAALGAAVIATSACGASDVRRCLTNDVGEVCLVGPDGDLKIEAFGLKAGTEFEFFSSSERTGELNYVVPDSGNIGGEIGLLGIYRDRAITISGTWESGETFDADIVVNP